MCSAGRVQTVQLQTRRHCQHLLSHIPEEWSGGPEPGAWHLQIWTEERALWPEWGVSESLGEALMEWGMTWGQAQEHQHKRYPGRGVPWTWMWKLGSKRKQHFWLEPEWWEVWALEIWTQREEWVWGRMMSSVLASVRWWYHDDIPVEMGSEGIIWDLLKCRD